MMPIIVSLPLRNITRKFAAHKILVKDLIYVSFRMYPPSPTVELPTLFVFTSRFGGFFLWFRRIILLNGRFFLRFASIAGSWGGFTLNFRFVLLNFLNGWQRHRFRVAHDHLLLRLFRYSFHWTERRLYEWPGRGPLVRLYLHRLTIYNRRRCRVLVGRYRRELDRLLVRLLAASLRLICLPVFLR